MADSADIDTALNKARQLADDRSQWLPAWTRREILQRLALLMESQDDALAQQASLEGGKPLMDSKIEVLRAIEGVKLAAEAINAAETSSVPMQLNPASARKIAHTRREPIGVVVAISAFNHPLNLIVHQAATAIAAGCPVIVKPASTTPLSCLQFQELIVEAGLPAAWCQVVLCTDANAEALATDSRIDFLTFIGSAKVGWILRSKLAPGTRCALEHGGIAPAIIEADADLDKVIPAISKGGFYHAGQVCVSVQRVYIHAGIIDEVASRLSTEAEKLKVGDPTHADTQVGPLITPKERERVDQWVQEAISEGATLLTGGKALNDTCYAPTILLNPSESSKVSTSEIFGPVICLYSYDSLDEAIEKANALPFAFQAAIFTQNIDTAMRASEAINASAVMINEHTAFRVDWMPFAGQQHAGLGTGGIAQSIHDMSKEKMVVINY